MIHGESFLSNDQTLMTELMTDRKKARQLTANRSSTKKTIHFKGIVGRLQ
ncbi:hypothetical protein [Bacillus pumilus]|nr:hypothetical protein [Bacillus pumilus]MCY7540175.1 hypothetical protein [Bacillus pumilus]MEC3591913.1 hypothetical protein [Bacillus pumilus]